MCLAWVVEGVVTALRGVVAGGRGVAEGRGVGLPSSEMVSGGQGEEAMDDG